MRRRHPLGAYLCPCPWSWYQSWHRNTCTCITRPRPRELEAVEYAMDKQLPGHLYAKSAIDLACWDILGQSSGLSLTQLLGGDRGGGVRIMSSVSSGTPDYMLDIIKDYRARGYVGHSVKVGGDVEKDIERIRYLEANRLPERILYDVNRAWSRREAIIVMDGVRDLGVSLNNLVRHLMILPLFALLPIHLSQSMRLW